MQHQQQRRWRGCSSPEPEELRTALAGTLLQANAAASPCVSSSEGDVGEEHDRVAASLKHWGIHCFSVSNTEPDSPFGAQARPAPAFAG